MNAPPGGTPHIQAFPEANREDRTAGFLSRKTLVREGMKVIADLGYDIPPARLRLLVQRFIEDGRSDLTDDRRSVADFRAWFITYADPTGETAVDNVLRSHP